MSYHLYVMSRVTTECLVDRTRLQLELNGQDIQTGIHYPTPLPLTACFQTFSATYRAIFPMLRR